MQWQNTLPRSAQYGLTFGDLNFILDQQNK